MRQFTSATAPRQGRTPGSKNKLSAQALQILDRLMADWMKHGAATLRVLRLERPDLYARLALETATRLTLAESSRADDVPTLLVVRWGDPRHPSPLPPEVSPPEPPHVPPPAPAPFASAGLLTFRRPLT